MTTSGLSELFKIPQVNIAILGYALFLVINACSLWGGVFPFFPKEFHTEDVTFAFMTAQSLASFLTYVVVLVFSFKMPALVTKSLHGVASFPAFLGGLLLIAALYLPNQRILIVIAAGCCLGIGGTLLSLVWARFFSAESTDRGNFYILAGTFCAPILFALLYCVPQAVRVFLVPLIFVPLCGLSVLLSFERLNKNLPIFQDAPAANIPVYARIVKIYWKSALAIGTLGFASGLIRAIAVFDVHLGDETNFASFLGLFLSAAFLLILWRKRSFSLNLRAVFMMSFPLVAACLATFPFAQGRIWAVLSGVVFLLFSLANTIVMLQSAHICINRGCNPFFVYGFFGAIVGLLQNAGFLFSYFANSFNMFGVHTNFAVSIIGLLVMTITLYVFIGKDGLFSSKLPQYDNVEFISLGKNNQPQALLMPGDASQSTSETIDLGEDEYQISKLVDATAEPEQEERQQGEVRHLPRITLRCKMLQEQYRLTSRETEILELIARGYTVSRIAEKHVVSENTVRTHTKHIYTKLGVHKKQELIAMVDALKGSEKIE